MAKSKGIYFCGWRPPPPMKSYPDRSVRPLTSLANLKKALPTLPALPALPTSTTSPTSCGEPCTLSRSFAWRIVRRMYVWSWLVGNVLGWATCFFCIYASRTQSSLHLDSRDTLAAAGWHLKSCCNVVATDEPHPSLHCRRGVLLRSYSQKENCTTTQHEANRRKASTCAHGNEHMTKALSNTNEVTTHYHTSTIQTNGRTTLQYIQIEKS